MGGFKECCKQKIRGKPCGWPAVTRVGKKWLCDFCYRKCMCDRMVKRAKLWQRRNTGGKSQ